MKLGIYESVVPITLFRERVGKKKTEVSFDHKTLHTWFAWVFMSLIGFVNTTVHLMLGKVCVRKALRGWDVGIKVRVVYKYTTMSGSKQSNECHLYMMVI